MTKLNLPHQPRARLLRLKTGTPVGDSKDAAIAEEGDSTERATGDDMEEQRTPDRPPSLQGATTTQELVVDLTCTS